jgi:dUTP pyrophosphatase
MAIDKNQLVVMYYVKEMRVEDIASAVGLKNAEGVRYYLFKQEPSCKKRDRKWSQNDTYELASLFANLATGDDFCRDAEKIAIAMQARKSIIEEKMVKMWEEKFKKVVNTDQLTKALNAKNVVEKEILKEEITVTSYGNDVVLGIYRTDCDDIDMPRYSSKGAAALDIMAAHAGTVQHGGGITTVKTGLVIKIPEGYCGLILPRSGLAKNYGVTVLNSPGLIDSDYCGIDEDGNLDEIKVLLINHSKGSSSRPFSFERGDRIAQLLIIPSPSVQLKEISADDLEDTTRGGFGSTGLN